MESYKIKCATVNIHGEKPTQEKIEKAIEKYIKAIKKEPTGNRLNQKNNTDIIEEKL